MRLIQQLDRTGCGIACFAMIAGITYRQAKRLIFQDVTTGRRSFSTTPGQIREALQGLGFLVADRLVRVPRDITRLRSSAILKVNLKNGGYDWHWVVYDLPRQRILDPRVPPYKRLRITSGLLIKTQPRSNMENEDNRIVGVEALFQKGKRLMRRNRSKPEFCKAIRLFRIGAQAGHLEAAYHLGMALRFVDERGEQLEEAFHWIKLAANRGHPDAQFNLGTAHVNGDGVRKNRVLALRWFILAGTRGDDDADRQCAIVASGLSLEQQKRAMAMAMRWKMQADMESTITEMLEAPGLFPPEHDDDDPEQELPRLVKLPQPIQ